MVMDDEFSLSDSEFAKVKSRIYEIAGISLSPAKKTLVKSRLSRILRTLKLDSFDAYIDFLDMRATGDDLQDFVNALTTNLTRFYREDHHFDHLVELTGRLIASGRQPRAGGRPRLRIWSAGCSTGQEPYTIGMSLLAAHPVLKTWDFKILATDVDSSVVKRAETGTYAETELAGLTPDRSAPFLRPGDGTIRVPDDVRRLITFRPLNLIGPWPFKGPFDAVFCRNVTIYFDKPTQRDVFERFRQVMRRDGYLYIGHSENLGSSNPGLRPVGKTVYQRVDMAGERAVA